MQLGSTENTLKAVAVTNPHSGRASSTESVRHLGMADEAEVKLKNLTVADEAEIKLFTSKFTPYGRRVEIALKEKKIPFRAITIDLTNKPQELLDANPIHKKVPTIIHNGKSVAESLVILEYLEEAFPEVPLMPKDAYEKARFRFWIDYMFKTYSTIQQGWQTKPGTPEKRADIEAYKKSLKTLEEGMSSFSADGPFFAGEKFGMIDIAGVPLYAAPLLQEISGLVTPGPDELPRFHKWCKAVSGHPSVSSTGPPTEEFLEYSSATIAKIAAAAGGAARTE